MSDKAQFVMLLVLLLLSITLLAFATQQLGHLSISAH